MDLAKPLTMPLNTAPVIRLTEEVLRQHTLDEMRQNGIPSEDFSERPCSIRDSVFAREEAGRKANGEVIASWPGTTSSRRRACEIPDSESVLKPQEERQKRFNEILQELPDVLEKAPTLATTVYTGNWKSEREYEDLQQELKEVTKRNLDIHPTRTSHFQIHRTSSARLALPYRSWHGMTRSTHPSPSPITLNSCLIYPLTQLSTASGSSGYTCPRQSMSYH